MNNSIQFTLDPTNSFSQPSISTSPPQDHVAKKRVRTGCFNCRRKHKKCDEQKPICKACVQRNEICEWPAPSNNRSRRSKRRKTTFMDTSKPTIDKSQTSTANCTTRSLSPVSDSSITSRSSSSANTVENMKAVEDYSKKLENMETSLNRNTNTSSTTDCNKWIVTPNALSGQSSSQNFNGSNPSPEEPMNITASNPLHEFERKSSISSKNDNDQNPTTSNFPFNLLSPNESTHFTLLDLNDLQDTFRDYMFANASNVNQQLDLNDSMLFNNKNIGVVNQSPDHTLSLSKQEEKKILKSYLYKVAPWLDMFDLTRQIGLKSVQLAKVHPCLKYAILALSARQMERTKFLDDPSISVALYQTSLKQLIPTVKKKPDIGAISACVTLCIFDMMSRTPEKWRYHLEGCSALFKATGINGFSKPYERALFWAFARMDVNSAVVGEQNTMIESNKWIPEGCSVHKAGELFRKEGTIDMYANYSVFLSSRVLNLISSTDVPNFDEEWEFLWNEVNEWHTKRHEEMKPIIEFENSPFPEVLYDNGPAIGANQLYHMSMILLMENKPRLYKLQPDCKSPTWHAKQICSISINNDHQGCWNNSVQTLYVAGRLLTHEDEHKIILDLMDEIETTTGWAMRFRGKDLKEFWDKKC